MLSTDGWRHSALYTKNWPILPAALPKPMAELFAVPQILYRTDYL